MRSVHIEITRIPIPPAAVKTPSPVAPEDRLLRAIAARSVVYENVMTDATAPSTKPWERPHPRLREFVSARTAPPPTAMPHANAAIAMRGLGPNRSVNTPPQNAPTTKGTVTTDKNTPIAVDEPVWD